MKATAGPNEKTIAAAVVQQQPSKETRTINAVMPRKQPQPQPQAQPQVVTTTRTPVVPANTMPMPLEHRRAYTAISNDTAAEGMSLLLDFNKSQCF